MSSQRNKPPTVPISARTNQAKPPGTSTPKRDTHISSQTWNTDDDQSYDSRSTTAIDIGIFQQSEAEEEEQSIESGPRPTTDENDYSEDEETQALKGTARPGLQSLSWESHDTDSESDAEGKDQYYRPTLEDTGFNGTPSNSTIDAMNESSSQEEEEEYFCASSVELPSAVTPDTDLPLTATTSNSSSRDNPILDKDAPPNVGSEHQQVLKSWHAIFKKPVHSKPPKPAPEEEITNDASNHQRY
jgi:hypothetical protein